MALLCHSPGSREGWNKRVFKKRRDEERQGAEEGQGLVSPRSQSTVQRTMVAT